VSKAQAIDEVRTQVSHCHANTTDADVDANSVAGAWNQS
jgi:hypothetical protein